MDDLSTNMDEERQQGTREIGRAVIGVALLATSAGLFEIARLVHSGHVSMLQIITTFAVVAPLIVYAFASWRGWVPKSPETIATVFCLVSIGLNLYFLNALFLMDWPEVVTQNMGWMIVLMTVPFLTVQRSKARRLAAILCLPIAAQISAYLWWNGIDLFEQSFGVHVLPFFFVLIAVYLLLDGFAMFREAAISFHARAQAIQATAKLTQQAADTAECARQEAEKSIALRETFLATMSHELRTPLNAIIGFSDAMQSDVLLHRGIEHYRTYAGDIHRSGEHVLGLIDQLLDYSRVRTGTFDLVMAPVKLEEVGDQVLRLAAHAAEKKSIKLQSDWSAISETQVIADRYALVQIGINLVINAIKFSPAHSTVIVKIAGDEAGRAVLSVTDRGTGIPADRLEEVKQPFVRVGDASLASETGTGLGLAIVSTLADGMNAMFELQSEIGKGTCARLVLHRMPGQPAVARCR